VKRWHIDPEQYADLRIAERDDELNRTNNLEAFVLRVFGAPVEIIVTPDGQAPRSTP
jgi:hypothetical protein